MGKFGSGKLAGVSGESGEGGREGKREACVLEFGVWRRVVGGQRGREVGREGEEGAKY